MFHGFTHLDAAGRARMVDVTEKPSTDRHAVARGRVQMSPATATMIATHSVGKGDVLAVARVAGIQAAKQTSLLVPLCHPLLVTNVSIDFDVNDDFVMVSAEASTFDRTGVEMEALTACAVAALTIYDMCKSFDRAMTIEGLGLWEKAGGRSGHWTRESANPEQLS